MLRLAGVSGEELAGAESAIGASVLEDMAYCEEEEIGRAQFWMCFVLVWIWLSGVARGDVKGFVIE